MLAAKGKKDLGAASRALAKATAGDNWKDTENYAPVLADFLDEGRRAAFAFVDVPAVLPPTLIEAKPSTSSAIPRPSSISPSYRRRLRRASSSRSFPRRAAVRRGSAAGPRPVRSVARLLSRLSCRPKHASKGEKVLAETVYDGRLLGGKVVKEGAIRDVHLDAPRRGARGEHVWSDELPRREPVGRDQASDHRVKPIARRQIPARPAISVG